MNKNKFIRYLIEIIIVIFICLIFIMGKKLYKKNHTRELDAEIKKLNFVLSAGEMYTFDSSKLFYPDWDEEFDEGTVLLNGENFRKDSSYNETDGVNELGYFVTKIPEEGDSLILQFQACTLNGKEETLHYKFNGTEAAVQINSEQQNFYIYSVGEKKVGELVFYLEDNSEIELSNVYILEYSADIPKRDLLIGVY